MTSPENVAVAKDEAWLVSANYDGNSATGFKWEGGEYVQKWKTEIPLAHGVAILGDRVFVSSLQLKRIFTLDLSNGTIRGVFGEPGWRVFCLNFLWPTGSRGGGGQPVGRYQFSYRRIYRISFQDGVGALIDVVGGTAPGLLGLQCPLWYREHQRQTGNSVDLFSKNLDRRPRWSNCYTQARADHSPASGAGCLSGERPPPSDPPGCWVGRIRPHRRAASDGQRYRHGAFLRITGEYDRGSSGPSRPRLYLEPDTLNLFGSYMYFIQAHLSRGAAILSSPVHPLRYT